MIAIHGKILLSTLLAFGLAHYASADVVYSDFSSTSPPYDDIDGKTVSGSSTPGGPGYLGAAASFTPGANFTLSSITLAFVFDDNDTRHPKDDIDSFTFSIDSDQSGAPGSVLESWTQGAGGTADTPNTVILNSTVSVSLQSGQTYWVVALPANSDSNGIWYNNNSGVINYDTTTDGTDWTENSFAPFITTPAFTVDGLNVVPSPAPLAGGAVLLSFLACSKRVRKLFLAWNETGT